MRIEADPAAPHLEIDNRLGAPDLAAQLASLVLGHVSGKPLSRPEVS